MKVRLPRLSPPVARAVSDRLRREGAEVSFDEGDLHDPATGLSLQVAVTALDVAPVMTAGEGVAFELARRVRDGAPLLLPDDEHTVFRLTWAADLARAVVIAARRQSEGHFGVAGREIWTLESLAQAIAARRGRRVKILRVPAHVIARAGAVPDAPSRPTPSLLPDFEPTPFDRWLPVVLDAAASRPAPDARPLEIALAARLQRRSS